jgi:hypothetical protein
VGADDPTAAWRTITSGEASLRLEEALVPFSRLMAVDLRHNYFLKPDVSNNFTSHHRQRGA